MSEERQSFELEKKKFIKKLERKRQFIFLEGENMQKKIVNNFFRM